MARRADWTHKTGLVLGALALIGLSGCDRQQERVDRATELGEAVLGQLNGEDVTSSARDGYASVPVESRAFAGTILERSVAASSDAAAPRFIIGSIVAKPANLPPAIEIAAIMETPEMSMDVVVDEQSEAKIIVPDQKTLDDAVENPEVIRRIELPLSKRSITVVDPEPQVRTPGLSSQQKTLPRVPLKETITQKRVERGLPTRGLREQRERQEQREVQTRSFQLSAPETLEQRIERLPKLNPKQVERALILPQAGLERQVIAEDRMIETATKFKVAASIQRSRSGQMVIEIGSDALNPTNFTEAVLQQGRIALENGVECDEVAAQAEDANPLIALECVIEDLRASGEFEYVEKDWLYEHQMMRRPDVPVTPVRVTPNDPLFDLQWHFKSQGNGLDQSPGGASFVDYWTDQDTQGASDVVVAIVDTGLQLNHPDIRNSGNVEAGWDMVSDLEVANDGNGRDDDPTDPGDICPARNVFENTFHGTHVAGIVGAAGTNNADGIAGGAWTVKIVPVRALGKCGGKLSDINDAIRWAAGTIPEYNALGEEVWNEFPADIINLSLGLFKACPASMQDAINAVTARGVTVVVAAGNRSVPTDFYAPAGCQNVVTVASGDARGYMAPYSNYGAAIDVLAPGGDLARDDNGDGHPDGVLSTKTAENCADPLTGAAVPVCYYAFEHGTSMAAPHVSAALALIKTKRPDLGSDALVSTLLAGVTPTTQAQCAGLCTQYPGAVPSTDDPDICVRQCGSGLLNLADVTLPD